jgi:hypothetical protein
MMIVEQTNRSHRTIISVLPRVVNADMSGECACKHRSILHAEEAFQQSDLPDVGPR